MIPGFHPDDLGSNPSGGKTVLLILFLHKERTEMNTIMKKQEERIIDLEHKYNYSTYLLNQQTITINKQNQQIQQSLMK